MEMQSTAVKVKVHRCISASVKNMAGRHVDRLWSYMGPHCFYTLLFLYGPRAAAAACDLYIKASVL